MGEGRLTERTTMFTIDLLPGKVFVPNEPLELPDLNLLGQPTILIEGDVADLGDFNNSVAAVAKAFTVLSTTDDTLTVTGHGLSAPSTVDNVVRAMVSNSGGSLPAGLAASTSYFYYVRVVDLNTVTLHRTAAGALANTERIDITSAGTGVHTMTWTVRALGEAVVRNPSTNDYELGVVGRANLPEMIGATAGANGARGAVPQPAAGDENKALHGDGTWRDATEGLRTGADLFLNRNSF